MTTNLPKLSAYKLSKVEEVEEGDRDGHVCAEVLNRPAVCGHCHSVSLRDDGCNEQVIRDLLTFGRRLAI